MVDIIIYGDIGGHFLPFSKSLSKHGVSLTSLGATIPKDTIVIQVGDLIDRGPDSDRLVHAVDNTIYESDPRWIQLMGNHECNWIGEWGNPCLFGGFENDTSDETKATIAEWWRSKRAIMAVGVITDDGEQYLITHSGLGAAKWMYYGRESDLRKMVRKLNADNFRDAFAAGIMLGGDRSKRKKPVGVAWAEATQEVYGSWVHRWIDNEEIPWHQVHGHSSAHRWNRGDVNPWWNFVMQQAVEAKVEPVLEADYTKRHEVCYIADKRFHGIDQSLGADPWFDVEPMVLQGEIVL